MSSINPNDITSTSNYAGPIPYGDPNDDDDASYDSLSSAGESVVSVMPGGVYSFPESYHPLHPSGILLPS
jgi:hypothetical protein